MLKPNGGTEIVNASQYFGVFYLILFDICLLAADITVVNIVQEVEDQVVARKQNRLLEPSQAERALE